MTQEEFKRQIKVIEEYQESQRKAGEFINKTFFAGSVDSAFDFGGDLIDLAIEQLSELSGIHRESIEWYMYGGRGVCKHTHDGFEMDIQTLEDFWNFEKH